MAEHGPQGPTEEHLVEELAGIMWRKRRLRLAEAAAHRHGLNSTLAPHRGTVKVALVHLDAAEQSERVVDAIRAPAANTEEDIREMRDDEAMTTRALDLLRSHRKDAYRAALDALREDTRDWWADVLASEPDDLDEGEEPATADAEGLLRFLEVEVLPWFEGRKKELSNRPLIREQAFGEALDPDKLERLGRYEEPISSSGQLLFGLLGECPQTSDHVACAPRAADHLFDRAARLIELRRLAVEPSQARVAIGDAASERLVDFVRDRGRQLPQGRQPRGVGELRLRDPSAPLRRPCVR